MFSRITAKVDRIVSTVMVRVGTVLVLGLFGWMVAVETGVIGDDSPYGDVIKRSSSGICHCPGGQHYERTRNFTPYRSIDECLASGGQHPKKGQGDCSMLAPPECGSADHVIAGMADESDECVEVNYERSEERAFANENHALTDQGIGIKYDSISQTLHIVVVLPDGSTQSASVTRERALTLYRDLGEMLVSDYPEIQDFQ